MQLDQRSLIIAVAAMVFLPLTFLTGLFGMNVPLPFQSSRHAFWIIEGGKDPDEYFSTHDAAGSSSRFWRELADQRPFPVLQLDHVDRL